MRGFNRVIIAGNLTRDPELRYTVNKKSYANFTVAVNNTWKNANGELQETTDYINVVAWGAQAETVVKYLKKGSPVLVEGSIRTRSYDAKDGTGKRYVTEVNMMNMIMLGSREGVSGSGGGFSSRDSSSGMDSFSPSGIPMPDDFGTNIGDRGFGGNDTMPDFANNHSGTSDPESTGIPF